MNKSLLRIFFICMCLSVFSCKNAKIASTEASDKITIKNLNKFLSDSKLNYEWLSARAKVEYQDEEIQQSFTAHIRIKKDEALWISLTGPFGIEGGRVLIASDTIRIIDRLNKLYYIQSVHDASNVLPFEMSLPDAQEIITGDPVDIELPKQKVYVENNMYKVSGALSGFMANYLVLPQWYKYHEIQLTDPLQNRHVNIQYDRYEEVENQLFATNRIIHFTNTQKDVYIEMDFSRIKINEPLTFPFEIEQDKYEIIR